MHISSAPKKLFLGPFQATYFSGHICSSSGLIGPLTAPCRKPGRSMSDPRRAPGGCVAVVALTSGVTATRALAIVSVEGVGGGLARVVREIHVSSVHASAIFPLPSSIIHLPSSIFHLPSSIFHLPSSSLVICRKSCSRKEVLYNL